MVENPSDRKRTPIITAVVVRIHVGVPGTDKWTDKSVIEEGASMFHKTKGREGVQKAKGPGDGVRRRRRHLSDLDLCGGRKLVRAADLRVCVVAARRSRCEFWSFLRLT